MATCADELLAIAAEFDATVDQASPAHLAVFIDERAESIDYLDERATSIDLQHSSACRTLGGEAFVVGTNWTDRQWELYERAERLILYIQNATFFESIPDRKRTKRLRAVYVDVPEGEQEKTEPIKACEKCKGVCGIEGPRLAGIDSLTRQLLESVTTRSKFRGYGGERDLGHHINRQTFVLRNALPTLAKYLRDGMVTSFRGDRWDHRSDINDLDEAIYRFPTKRFKAIVQSEQYVERWRELSYFETIEVLNASVLTSMQCERLIAATGMPVRDLVSFQRLLRRYCRFPDEYITETNWLPLDVLPVLETCIAKTINADEDPDKVLFQRWAEWKLPNQEESASDKFVQANPRSPPMQSGSSRIKWLANAMLLVQEHPDWSDAKIAKKVDKHPSQLSRSTEYQIAAGMARGSKENLRKGHRTGDSDSGFGAVEAYDYDDDFEG